MDTKWWSPVSIIGEEVAVNMIGALLFGLGLLLGYLLFSHPRAQDPEWSVSIEMDIVEGSSYPLTLKRKGKDTALPQGANVVWGDAPAELGAVTVDPNDATKATIVGGTPGATGTVTAKVTFNGHDGNPKEVDAASEALTVVVGEPDGGNIEVGAELP